MNLYPSEIDRLIYGHLLENKLYIIADIFLKESPHLEEHRKLIENGKIHALTVDGKTLTDLLERHNSEKGVHVGVQTDSSYPAYNVEGVEMDVHKLIDEESVNEDEENFEFPSESTSPKLVIEPPSVTSLKISDSFTISDDLFDKQTFQNIDCQYSVEKIRRKSVPHRKLPTDSTVHQKMKELERHCIPHVLPKYMEFLDQLLCEHPATQKIVYTINKAKKNILSEDNNLLPSNKDSTHIEEIVRNTLAEVESIVYVPSYLDFLSDEVDFCMSFKKSRLPNFDEHHEKLSTLSSEAHEASHLAECLAKESTIMPLEIIPDMVNATENIADLHEKSNSNDMNEIPSDHSDDQLLFSHSWTEISNITEEENEISECKAMAPDELLGKHNSEWKQSLPVLEKEDNIQPSGIKDSTSMDLSLNVTNLNDSIPVALDSSNIQNYANEASVVPSELDAGNKNISNSVMKIPSDQSDGPHSQQDIIMEENIASKCKVIRPADPLEKQDLGQSIPEKMSNIQQTYIQSNTTSIDLSINVTNAVESISVAPDSSNIQNSIDETSGVPSKLDAGNENISNSVMKVPSDDQSDGPQSQQDVIMEENIASKSEVMISADLLQKQNLGQLIPEKVGNIQLSDVQSITLIDPSINVTNTVESISVAPDSSNIQNSINETSEMPPELDAIKKNISNSVIKILSVDQSNNHSLSIHSQQDIVMEENNDSKSKIMVPATELEGKQNFGELIPEKIDIQSADIQSATLKDLSSNVTSIKEFVSVAPDSSNIQNSAIEPPEVPSELDVNQISISNTVKEIFPDEQIDEIPLPLHFQEKVSDVIRKEILNAYSESEAMMPNELSDIQNSEQISLLSSEESSNVTSPSFSNSTSKYAPIMTVFQNNNYSQPSNPFITSQFPSACLNSIFKPGVSNMYFVQDNFVYQVLMQPSVNCASSLNSNLFDALSSTNDGSQSILNLPAPTSNNSLASLHNGILPVSSSCSVLPTSSVLSSFSNNSTIPTLSSTSSTGILRNVQSSFFNNTLQTMSNNVLSVPSNCFILPAPPESNNLPHMTKFVEGQLNSSVQCSSALSTTQPISLDNTSHTGSKNVLPVLSNGITLPATSEGNNLPLLTNIANVPLYNTTHLNTNILQIPVLSNKNITQIPMNSPQVTSIVGTLQDVELVIAENTVKESTKSLLDIETPIVSAEQKKSKKDKKAKGKGQKQNDKCRPKNSGNGLNKKPRRRPRKRVARRPLFPINPNLKDYATVGLVQPVLPSNELNLSSSSNQKQTVMPNSLKNQGFEEENVNDRKEQKYSGLPTSTSNCNAKNNFCDNGSLSIQSDSETNNATSKSKNPLSISSELNEMCLVKATDILNRTNSDVNAESDEIAVSMLHCSDSATLNSMFSDADSPHGVTNISSICSASSSHPISSSVVDVVNDEMTDSGCVIDSNVLNEINSDEFAMYKQTITFLESQTNLPVVNGIDSDKVEEGDQTTVFTSSSKDCAQFSNTHDHIINHEMDEEDIPLSELKNRKYPGQSVHLKVFCNKVCNEVSNTASDSEEDIVLSEFLSRKSHKRKFVTKHQNSSGLKKEHRKRSKSLNSYLTSEFSQSSNILENDFDSDNGANKYDAQESLGYSNILNSLLFSSSPNCKSPSPLRAKNVCGTSYVPEHLLSSRDGSCAEVGNSFLCSSVVTSNKHALELKNNINPVYSDAFQNNDSSPETIDKHIFLSQTDTGCSKKINNHSASRKCKNIVNLDGKVGSSKSKRKENSTKRKSPEISLKHEEKTFPLDLVNLRNDEKKEVFSNFPVELENPCSIPSSVSEHLSSSCDETKEARNLSVSLFLKDSTKEQNVLNSTATVFTQSDGVTAETLDNTHSSSSQTDNDFFNERNHNHFVSRKSEAISNLHQNVRFSKTKRKRSPNKIYRIKLKKFRYLKEGTSYSVIEPTSIDDKHGEETSNFPVELGSAVCQIPLSVPEYLSTCGKTPEQSDLSVSPAPVISSHEDNVNSTSSEFFQNNASSVETLDNKQASLAQTGNNCFIQENDNHAVSKKWETIGEKIDSTEMKKNSSNETIKRKLPSRFTKLTEKAPHSDLSNLKTNEKTCLDVSNSLAETEDLHAIPSLPANLSSNKDIKETTNNTSPGPLLLRDDTFFQNTLHPVTTESYESDNSSPERVAGTNTSLKPTNNNCFEQACNVHTISRKSETIGNLNQSIKSTKRKRTENTLKGTSKRRSRKKFTKQKTKSSYSKLVNKKAEKSWEEISSDFSVEGENLAVPSFDSDLSNCSYDKQVGVENSLMHSLPRAPSELKNSFSTVPSYAFPGDDSPAETIDDIRAFLSSTDIKGEKSVSSEFKENISDKDYNQNIRSSEIKVLCNHSRKQANPKKITSPEEVKNKLKNQSKNKRNCKRKSKAQNLDMQKTCQALNLKVDSSRKIDGQMNGMKETSKDLLKSTAQRNDNGKKQNGCQLSFKKLKSVKSKLDESSEEPLCSKQKANIKIFDSVNDFSHLSDKNNLDIHENPRVTTSLDKRVTPDLIHKVVISRKKRLAYDYFDKLKHEYLENCNILFQIMFLLIAYAKLADQSFFQVKEILLFRYKSQQNHDDDDDLLGKYLDGKLQIENLKTKSILLKSALNSVDSDKSPSIDILKQLCSNISAILQKFERRFKFSAKMYREKMQVEKTGIFNCVDLHLLYLKLKSIKESLRKKSAISKEKVYSFEDPAFSLTPEQFSQQPLVVLEKLSMSTVERNTMTIKNLDLSSLRENQKTLLDTLLDVNGSVLKTPPGLTIEANLISFKNSNVWPEKFKKIITSIFETTMDTAQFVHNILYNSCEYARDISNSVLGNKSLHQKMSHNLLVDSSEKKSNFFCDSSLEETIISSAKNSADENDVGQHHSPSNGKDSFLEESIISSAENLADENNLGQHHSPSKRQRVSFEDLPFAEEISTSFGDSTVENSQNSRKTGLNFDLKNEQQNYKQQDKIFFGSLSDDHILPEKKLESFASQVNANKESVISEEDGNNKFGTLSKFFVSNSSNDVYGSTSTDQEHLCVKIHENTNPEELKTKDKGMCTAPKESTKILENHSSKISSSSEDDKEFNFNDKFSVISVSDNYKKHELIGFAENGNPCVTSETSNETNTDLWNGTIEEDKSQNSCIQRYEKSEKKIFGLSKSSLKKRKMKSILNRKKQCLRRPSASCRTTQSDEVDDSSSVSHQSNEIDDSSSSLRQSDESSTSTSSSSAHLISQIESIIFDPDAFLAAFRLETVSDKERKNAEIIRKGVLEQTYKILSSKT